MGNTLKSTGVGYVLGQSAPSGKTWEKIQKYPVWADLRENLHEQTQGVCELDAGRIEVKG